MNPHHRNSSSSSRSSSQHHPQDNRGYRPNNRGSYDNNRSYSGGGSGGYNNNNRGNARFRRAKDGATSTGKRKAGNMRNQAKLLEYKKFLPLCMDKKLRVKISCDRFMVGILEGYDPLDNLTLANCIDQETQENLGTVLIRGSAIERIEALEGMDERPNFVRLGVSR